MPKNENQKLKLLYLHKILLEKTDSEHGLSVADIISELEDYGISAERKSIYSDIEALIDFGLDIEKCREGSSTVYKVISREFELPELKLLADAVQSARFLSKKKSLALISKLSSLTSENEAKGLRREIYMSERLRSDNEQVYYAVDTIHTAIEQNVKITFLYFYVNEKKEKIYRHDKALYTVSPWGMIFSDGNYYLVAYDSAFQGMKHFRIDKMEQTKLVSESRDGRSEGEDLDLSQYAKKMFGMFGGNETLVTLRAENRLSGILLDRFGQDITFIKKDEEHFETSIRVSVSPQFLGWIMSFGKSLVITSPEDVVKKYKDLAREIIDY